MHLAKRLSWLMALAFLSTGLAACKKDEKKEDGKTEEKKEGAEEKQEGTEEAKQEGTEEVKKEGTEEAKKEEAPPPEAQKAMKGFAIAVDKAPDQPGSGGGLGGMGSMFGAMFGGDKAEAAPMPTGDTAAPTTPTTPTEPAQPTAGGTTASGIPLDLKMPPPGQAGGDCAAVADRLMGIVVPMIEVQMAEAYKTMTPEQKAAAEQYLKDNFKPDDMKGEFVKMCETQAWPQDLKDCVLTAADVPALEQCESMMPKDAAAPADDPGDYAADVAAPTAEAPAWTGGNSCDDVGKRVMQIYTLSMGDTSQWDQATKDQVAKQLDEAAAQFSQTCKDASFSEAVRDCLVKSNTLEATEACWALMGQTPQP